MLYIFVVQLFLVRLEFRYVSRENLVQHTKYSPIHIIFHFYDFSNVIQCNSNNAFLHQRILEYALFRFHWLGWKLYDIFLVGIRFGCMGPTISISVIAGEASLSGKCLRFIDWIQNKYLLNIILKICYQWIPLHTLTVSQIENDRFTSLGVCWLCWLRLACLSSSNLLKSIHQNWND